MPAGNCSLAFMIVEVLSAAVLACFFYLKRENLDLSLFTLLTATEPSFSSSVPYVESSHFPVRHFNSLKWQKIC